MLPPRFCSVRSAVVCFVLALGCAYAFAAVAIKEEVAPLGTLQKVAQFDQMKVASDGWCAYVVKQGKQFAVVSGDTAGKPYDQIKLLVASTDPAGGTTGAHVAYAAQTGKTWCVVQDGVEGQAYDDVDVLRLSPDGKRVAYAAQKGKQWTVVLDGKEGKLYDDISANEATFVQVAHPNWWTGGVIYSTHTNLVAFRILEFDPTGKRLAYVAVIGTQRVAVIDGDESEKYDEVNGLQFSPDGTRVAYGVKQGKSAFMVVDGTPGPAFDEVYVVNVLFSPNSNRVAYVARAGGKPLVVVDGQPSPPYDRILEGPVFSPDSKHAAYALLNGTTAGGLPTYHLSIDNTEVKPDCDASLYGRPSDLTWSPDSKRLAYWADKPAIRHGTTIFSPVSGHGWCLVADQKQVYIFPPCPGDWVLPFLFSPQGTHMAAVIPQGKDKRFMMVDGVAGQEKFDEVLNYWFSDDSTVSAVARRGQQIVKVTVHITP
jgi:Tol biopolymer transport system component